MLFRILFVIISMLIVTQSAPSPYFTRSFVQTPSSTYEQYLIVPDKSDAYRVPMSQVHHYSDFQFPKQQVVYFNPSAGTNPHRLEALKKDNPLWQQMLMNLHSKSDENMLMNDDALMAKMNENIAMQDTGDQKVMNEDTMRMILDQENVSSDMMEKLKRDDTKISEMMKDSEESTTFAPQMLLQPIVVASNEDDRMEQNDKEIEPNMMEPIRNLTNEIVPLSQQIHPEMTRVIVPESNLQQTSTFADVPENNEPFTDSEALNEIQTESPTVSRIAELISNVEPIEISTILNQLRNEDNQMASTTEQPQLKSSKEYTLEIMRNIKDHPEIMIKIVELAAATIQEMESDLRSESMKSEESTTEQNIATTESSLVESTESAQSPELVEIEQVNMVELSPSSSVSEFSSESGQTSTDSPKILDPTESPVTDNEIQLSTESPMTLLETSTQTLSESSTPQIQSRFENSEPEIESSNEKMEESTSERALMQDILDAIEIIESSEKIIEDTGSNLRLSNENDADTPQTTETPDLIESTTLSLKSIESSTESESELQEIIQSSTESVPLESSQSTEAIKSNDDESTEAIIASTTESITLQESSPESSGIMQEVQIIQISMTSKTDNSDQVNLTMTDNIEQSVTRSDIPLNVNDNESNENKISSSEEQTSFDSGEREVESEEEQTALKETPQNESDETMREGRVNKTPTMFLHNNRFYVISGVPEFYANFDAYQNPRTPIFSLQELQPIRPMNNVAIQKIEPFRIYVDDNEEQKSSSTQDDNEPLKMQSSTTDNPRRDIENTQSMNMEQRESEMEREMTVKVKKRVQDRQPESEARQNANDEEEPTVAQASPEAVSISGRGGVSSAGGKGIALSNDGGISVASPKATAISGKYNIRDSDDGIDVDFEDDVKIQNKRRVQVARRKIIRGRRYERL